MSYYMNVNILKCYVNVTFKMCCREDILSLHSIPRCDSTFFLYTYTAIAGRIWMLAYMCKVLSVANVPWYNHLCIQSWGKTDIYRVILFCMMWRYNVCKIVVYARNYMHTWISWRSYMRIFWSCMQQQQC